MERARGRLLRGPGFVILAALVTDFEHLQLAAMGEALDGGHFVEQEDAVEVVEFVLDGAGGQSGDFGDVLAAFEVLVTDLDASGAGNLDEDAGEAEAAFLTGDGLVAFEDEGVDHGDVAFLRGRQVDDAEAEGEADLCGGETDAVGALHGGEHHFGGLAKLVIELGDGLGFAAKEIVGVAEDVQCCAPWAARLGSQAASIEAL